ncbi:MAG: phosphatidate cytidylyltransferase [Bacteroidetes bacterium]|nr:phosphatidate cytidylyltransferase [Bacteroidota bacterium]
MAFNFQVFKTRTLTAIVFAAFMLLGLFANTWTYLLLFTIIHFGCWYEYQKLVALIIPGYKNISVIQKIVYPFFGFMLMLRFAGILNSFSFINDGSEFITIMIICILFLEIVFYKRSGIENIAASLLGFAYISLPITCMIAFRLSGNFYIGSYFHFDMGLIIPILLIATIWINDTMAYIVGSLIGKTPLTKISPKKTWEGTLGGALLAIATISAVTYFLFQSNIISTLLFTGVAVIFATLGDLFESKIKRLAKVKDSGNFLPGHGGFLDRFDSLLFAAPAIWILLLLM